MDDPVAAVPVGRYRPELHRSHPHRPWQRHRDGDPCRLPWLRHDGRNHGDRHRLPRHRHAASPVQDQAMTVMTRALARLLLPVTMMVAAAVLIKGYADVGDGFSAGIIASLGVLLHYVSFGPALPGKLAV